MSENTCACPECVCIPGADAVRKDDKLYCCEACAEQHPQGKERCVDLGCQCGAAAVRRSSESQPKEEQIDKALEETFPASDPISP
ncbi:Prokaryotic metallothionein [compost metagenome]|uniref:Metallothionein n=1 Tax=Pseudomonas jinjuensis TaxID=198616 RepID=A0A1H0LH92_9PSED|nr:metallothionein [Pseudomonas jinjuensis]SDO67290.1 metallothionein [Pseudomonas jinjuensis]